MADNPLGIIEQLSKLEQAEYDALDKTPPPEDILKELRKPASVGWVRKYVDTHSRWCPAQRMLRRLAIAALILIGAVLVLNVAGVLVAKSVFRAAVKEVLVEEGLIRAQQAPLPTKSGLARAQ